jgi:hypothetical protein
MTSILLTLLPVALTFTLASWTPSRAPQTNRTPTDCTPNC